MSAATRFAQRCLVFGGLVLGLTATSADAAIFTASKAGVVQGPNSQKTIDLISAGVLASAEDFSVAGTFSITPGNGVNFNPIFLVTDTSVFYGGELDDQDNDTNTDIRAYANVGSSVNNASAAVSSNESLFTNQTNVATPVVVDFVVTNDASVTTATVTYNAANGSRTSTAVPFDALDPQSNGLSLVIANLDDAAFTYDLNVTVIPEPVAVSLLGGLALACLGRRRSA